MHRHFENQSQHKETFEFDEYVILWILFRNQFETSIVVQAFSSRNQLHNTTDKLADSFVVVSNASTLPSTFTNLPCATSHLLSSHTATTSIVFEHIFRFRLDSSSNKQQSEFSSFNNQSPWPHSFLHQVWSLFWHHLPHLRGLSLLSRTNCKTTARVLEEEQKTRNHNLFNQSHTGVCGANRKWRVVRGDV